jgi:hypothetical protein
MKLTAHLVDVAEVTPPQRDEMFALMHGHYANVHRQVFEADLAEKRWVILIRDPACDGLRGFSTQTLLDATVAGRLVKALFSGDTIIHRSAGATAPFPTSGAASPLRLLTPTPARNCTGSSSLAVIEPIDSCRSSSTIFIRDTTHQRRAK